MSKYSLRASTAIVALFLAIGGCTTANNLPVAGTVITRSAIFGEGSYAPDIMFADLKGRLQHLSSFYDNASIIAFVGGNCLEKSDPQLIEMASHLRSDVAVVEICSTGTKPGEVEQCRMVRGIKEKNLITICDGGGAARSAYHVTTSTAVFVLDRMGFIKVAGTINELGTLRRKAESIAAETEKIRENLYEGG